MFATLLRALAWVAVMLLFSAVALLLLAGLAAVLFHGTGRL